VALQNEEKAERRSWFGQLHLIWAMLLLVGWLLYEITAQPGLAALVACAKFGWADARTAFWLRRVDPDRWRGQACFWGYLTYALWKVAIMATLTTIALGFLGVLFDRGGRRPANNDFSPVLSGALAAAALGFGLSFPLSYIALWSARRNGVRLWLGQAPNRARKEQFWPPRHGRLNAAPFVVFTSLALTVWFLLLLMISLAVLVQPGGMGVLVFLTATMLALITVVLSYLQTSLRVIARSPQECWAIEEGEAVYQARANPRKEFSEP
jgi:hypothetical protein